MLRSTSLWWLNVACATFWLWLSIKTALLAPYLAFCFIVAWLIVARRFAVTDACRARVVEIRLLHVGLNSRIWHPRDVWYVLTGRV